MLDTQNLAIGYQGRNTQVLLENLSLSLHRGELTCLLGANGTGKSTLLRTLAGLQKPLWGDIFWQGLPIAHIPKKKRAQLISLVLTENLTTERLTVGELVSLGRYPHTNWIDSHSEADLVIITKALQATGIGHLAEQPFFALSDGQKQKALIARALAQDGGAIFLDEPTAHLDWVSRYEVILNLRQVAQKQQKAILVSTHELSLALQQAHRLWLITPEKKLLVGLAEDLALDGSLANFFPHQHFTFEAHTGNFLLKNTPTFAPFLEGDALATYWTEVALQKTSLTPLFFESKHIKIAAERHQAAFLWQAQGFWKNEEGAQNFESLSKLIDFLVSQNAIL
ncbi:ABC transporter ATP-binding protein [Hugenholtzia roseola]|uniref:ABC transporter ATP-binding protein n=1 Tax=Hugenholtzia roseola TaxID=1002 RepID=UPI000427E82B|nr:ABC transporter ATP-binding protein [Hugenholtzia roseola]